MSRLEPRQSLEQFSIVTFYLLISLSQCWISLLSLFLGQPKLPLQLIDVWILTGGQRTRRNWSWLHCWKIKWGVVYEKNIRSVSIGLTLWNTQWTSSGQGWLELICLAVTITHMTSHRCMDLEWNLTCRCRSSWPWIFLEYLERMKFGKCLQLVGVLFKVLSNGKLERFLSITLSFFLFCF